ncbi:MAG: PH domain-containing protein [Candidatus Gastranaerophilales bacterium]|nr:PH domain-containing protein [Candidatus Gastranaerophilales bacterium]
MLDESLRNLALMVNKDEKVLWFAKPNKKCFILECVFNPLLPFAFVWLLFDSFFIIGASQAKNASEAMTFLIPFMAFHLMPVWIYIGGVLTSFLRYKNAAYIITTKGVYISSGVISKTQEMKPFTDLAHINIHRGIFDQFLGVGDVILTCAHNSISAHNSRTIHGFAIQDIPDYEKVFKMIKELQTDIYSDTMYPNALRPENNPGYNTQYNKFEHIDIEN